MNITDIDDKIIKKAISTDNDWREVVKNYEESFSNSMEKLNVEIPDKLIIIYIQKIINNGYKYHENVENIEIDDSDKKDKRDFALWKARNVLNNEIGFDAEFIYNDKNVYAYGRPGWHIECSTMINKTLGKSIDIHLGGIDLKFPHHYNEELQSIAYNHPLYKNTNKKWVNEFYHVGHLCIISKDGIHQKMSKSLKNFTTINSALESMTPNQMRWLFLTHNWKKSMNFSDETIYQAKKYDSMIHNFINTILKISNTKECENDDEFNKIDAHKNNIIEFLKNLDFEKFSRELELLISETFKLVTNKSNNKIVTDIYHFVSDMFNNLGFLYTPVTSSIDDIMDVLIDTRSQLKLLIRNEGKKIPKEIKTKIYKILDEERDIKLANINISLMDTQYTSYWMYSNK
jgi:cysteinyl-tRNA synthetase